MNQFKDLIARNPLQADPNWNKSSYHTFMGWKLLMIISQIIECNDEDEIKIIFKELMKLIYTFPTILEEFATFNCVYKGGLEYITYNDPKSCS